MKIAQNYYVHFNDFVNRCYLEGKPKENTLSNKVDWFIRKRIFTFFHLYTTLIKAGCSIIDGIICIPTTVLSIFPTFTSCHTINRLAKETIESATTVNSVCFYHIIKSINPDAVFDTSNKAIDKWDAVLCLHSKIEKWNDEKNTHLTNLISLVALSILRIVDCTVKSFFVPIATLLNLLPIIPASQRFNRYAYTSLNILLVFKDIYSCAIRILNPRAFD